MNPLTWYHELLREYGPQHWWPKHSGRKRRGFDPRCEILVGAILTQNTSWENAKRAIESLYLARCLDIPSLRHIPLSKLRNLIKPSGYFNQKAKKLRVLTEVLSANPNPTREELLSLWGIGRETADSILLYAFKQPFFVVDAYTRRFLRAHGESALANQDYEVIRGFFEMNLPLSHSLYNEYHALIVRWGKGQKRTRQTSFPP